MPAIHQAPNVIVNPAFARVNSLWEQLLGQKRYETIANFSFTSYYGDGLATLGELYTYLVQTRNDVSIVMTKSDLEFLSSFHDLENSINKQLLGQLAITPDQQIKLVQLYDDTRSLLGEIHEQLIENSLLLDDQPELWAPAKATDEI